MEMIWTVLIIMCTSILAVFFWRSRGLEARTVLIVGLSGSGKTVFFQKLVHGQTVATLRSMKVNRARLVAGNRWVEIIDVPGHVTLRGDWVQWLDQGKCVGILFVVDGTTISKELCQCGSFLLDVWKEAESRGIGVLVGCNKMDLGGSVSQRVIQTGLLSEMRSLIRHQKTLNVSQISGKVRNRNQNNPESLEQKLGGEHGIEFVSISMAEMKSVMEWIGRLNKDRGRWLW